MRKSKISKEESTRGNAFIPGPANHCMLMYDD